MPMFPLNTVLFPGMEVPLHVFEDRYRLMVRHLLEQPLPERSFGSVAIREGYEVGDHGQQELHRIGCRLLLREVVGNPDGSFDVVAESVDRIRMNRLDSHAEFPRADVDPLPDHVAEVAEQVTTRAVELFAAYRQVLFELRGDPLPLDLPTDATSLAWALAAATPMTFPERQDILEAPDTSHRLALLIDLIQSELQVMRVLPSLPASQVARTGWHPN